MTRSQGGSENPAFIQRNAVGYHSGGLQWEEFMNRRHALRAAAAVCLAWSLPRAHAQGTRATVKLALNRAPDASFLPALADRAV